MEQHFHTTKERVITDRIPYTAEQLEAIINEQKPREIWHSEYSSKEPFISITEYNDEGFMMWCHGAADKTPTQYNAAKLHAFLKYQGLACCYITPDLQPK